MVLLGTSAERVSSSHDLRVKRGRLTCFGSDKPRSRGKSLPVSIDAWATLQTDNRRLARDKRGAPGRDRVAGAGRALLAALAHATSSSD